MLNSWVFRFLTTYWLCSDCTTYLGGSHGLTTYVIPEILAFLSSIFRLSTTYVSHHVVVVCHTHILLNTSFLLLCQIKCYIKRLHRSQWISITYYLYIVRVLLFLCHSFITSLFLYLYNNIVCHEILISKFWNCISFVKNDGCLNLVI